MIRVIDAYGRLQTVVSGVFNGVLKSVDPTVNDDETQGYSVETQWLNTSANKVFVCMNASEGEAVWVELTAATDSDAVHDNVAGEIAAVDEKETPHNDDLVLVEDSEDSNAKKSVKLSNLPGGGSGVDTSGTPEAGDFSVFTDADTIEGKSAAETLALLSVESGADVTDADNVAAAGAAMSGGAFHDGFSDFVADEHSPSASIGEVDTGSATNRHINPNSLRGSMHGKRTISVLVNAGDAIATGNGQAYFGRIPSYLIGWNIIEVAANRVAGTGLLTIMIHNFTQSADILTTALTIDANEKDSKDAASAAVIDTGQDDVATGDRYRVDVDGDVGGDSTWVEVQMTLQKP